MEAISVLIVISQHSDGKRSRIENRHSPNVGWFFMKIEFIFVMLAVNPRPE